MNKQNIEYTAILCCLTIERYDLWVHDQYKYKSLYDVKAICRTKVRLAAA